jgi:hypothetical protein
MFRDWLISVGFIQSQTSPILFARTEPDGSIIRLIFYIDDGIYGVSSEGDIDRFKK